MVGFLWHGIVLPIDHIVLLRIYHRVVLGFDHVVLLRIYHRVVLGFDHVVLLRIYHRVVLGVYHALWLSGIGTGRWIKRIFVSVVAFGTVVVLVQAGILKLAGVALVASFVKLRKK